MSGPTARRGSERQQHQERTPKTPKRPKTKSHRKWESTFGKHTARCHPRSFVELIGKEGKPILLLVIIGICASSLDYFIDSAVVGLGMAKTKLIAIDSFNSSPYAMLAAWSAFTIVAAQLACIWTVLVDPFAAGSGIPEMKTIIACDLRKEADQYLGARTLLSKAVGLTLALGSGISVGREGPFVHTSSIIAHRLMKHVGFFHRVYKNDILRRHVYNAACAVGVASTFRAPIGGVLFSIEVTSTVFMLSNYWRAFVAALSGSITRQIVSLLRESELSTYHPMFPTSFSPKSFVYTEYLAFAVLGLLMGVTGALYVVLSSFFKRWWKTRSANHPLLWGLLLLVPTCLLLYLPGEFGRSSSWDLLTDLFDTNELSERWTDEVSPVVPFLPLAGLCRLAATILSTSLLLPAGDFVPTFTAGAIFGRLFGELVALSFPDSKIIPGGYALVGGAALVASVTQTISVAVIAMEFTGQFVYLNPLVLSTLIASSVASALSVSIYDSVIISKGLTYLPILRVNLLEDVKARDVMEVDIPLLTMTTSAAKLQRVLLLEPTHSIPVVSDLDTMIFYGCVARSSVDQLYQQSALSTDPLASDTSNEKPKGKEDEVRRCSSPTFQDTQQRIDTTEMIRKQQKRSSLCTITVPTSKKQQQDSTTTVPGDTLRLRSDEESFLIDSSVLQVDVETAITKVHLLFEMIKCSRIWVTRRGKLIGRIDRAHLHQKILELKKERSINII
ncbi:hypothetical protein Gpo141_00002188 [Globisporangium polare]